MGGDFNARIRRKGGGTEVEKELIEERERKRKSKDSKINEEENAGGVHRGRRVDGVE